MSLHPLMSKAAWQLMPGASQALPVRRAGMALFLLSGVMLLAWLGALVHEAWVWGVHPAVMCMAVLLALGWCHVVWLTWQRWRAPQAGLTLLWTGPIERPRARSSLDQEPASGGFRVRQWDADVLPQVAFDFQRWMLLRLSTPSAKSNDVWVWLDLGQAPASMHQLRTLLYLPPSMISLEVKRPPELAGQQQRQSQPMASWANLFNLGIKLRSVVALLRGIRQHPSLDRDGDTLFPPTQLLQDDAARLCAPDQVRGYP
jgi:hypothetical protein